MKKLLIHLAILLSVSITNQLSANISGSGIVGGAITTESVGENAPRRKIKTGTEEELKWLRERVKSLNEENKRLKNSRNRNVSQQSRIKKEKLKKRVQKSR